MYPARFPTGIRKTTITNPAQGHLLFDQNISVYEGDVAGFDFEKQKNNFQKLEAVLNENGTGLSTIHVAIFGGYDRKKFVRFVALTANGMLTWEKYENGWKKAGQNYVYTAGRKIRLSEFLSLEKSQQRGLLSGDQLWSEICGSNNIGVDYLNWIG